MDNSDYWLKVGIKKFFWKIFDNLGISAAISGSIAAWIISIKKSFQVVYSQCETNLAPLKCYYENIKWDTVWIALAFLLSILVYYLLYKKLSSPKSTNHSEEIKAIKLLYNFLESFPYEGNNQRKLYYMSSYSNNTSGSLANNKIEKSLFLLLSLSRRLYEEERLKNHLKQFDGYFYPDVNGMTYPIFKSKIEFQEKQQEIKKLLDSVIRNLKKNKVS